MAVLATLIGDPSMDVFRRLSIKRRSATTGLFESSWVDVSQYVKKWGTVERSVDDVKLNRFRNSGFNFSVRNDTGAFNQESNQNSLWFGYLTRMKTLVKVEGGYLDQDGGELPTDSSLGVFIMDQELPQSGHTNEIAVPCSSLQSIFDGRASEIGGILGLTMTASEIIGRIRDHTDGAGAFVFRQFITSTAWTIETTTSYYNLTTTSSQVQGMSLWEFMSTLAEAERKVCYVNRTGGLEFRSRSARTTTAAFAFYGQGFPRPNIIKLDRYFEAWDKFYSYFRLKYIDSETTTSYVTAGTTTVVSATNVPWKYKARTYEAENTFIVNTATAQAIVDGLHTEFGTTPPIEVEMLTKFVPPLEPLDLVTASYHSYDLAGGTLWDVFDWDDGHDWATEGENFDWDDREFKVLGIRIDLQTFTAVTKAKEE